MKITTLAYKMIRHNPHEIEVNFFELLYIERKVHDELSINLSMSSDLINAFSFIELSIKKLQGQENINDNYIYQAFFQIFEELSGQDLLNKNSNKLEIDILVKKLLYTNSYLSKSIGLFPSILSSPVSTKQLCKCICGCSLMLTNWEKEEALPFIDILLNQRLTTKGRNTVLKIINNRRIKGQALISSNDKDSSWLKYAEYLIKARRLKDNGKNQEGLLIKKLNSVNDKANRKLDMAFEELRRTKELLLKIRKNHGYE